LEAKDINGIAAIDKCIQHKYVTRKVLLEPINNRQVLQLKTHSLLDNATTQEE